MSDKINTTKTEVMQEWSFTDVLHAHLLLDQFEISEHRQAQKIKRR